jgi:hypothetical protein
MSIFVLLESCKLFTVFTELAYRISESAYKATNRKIPSVLNTVILLRVYSQIKFCTRLYITVIVRRSRNNKKYVKLFIIYHMCPILNKVTKYYTDVCIIGNNSCMNRCQNIYYDYEGADLEISGATVPHSAVRVYIGLRKT